jgi:hypothetical protein
MDENLSQRAPKPWVRSPVIVGLFLAAVGGIAWATAALQAGDGDCRDLGELDEFGLGTVSEVSCVDAYVVNVTGDPVVFLAESPHLENEPIRWDGKQKLFRALHDETFDVTGAVKTGPSPRPLWKCPTEVEDNRLKITSPQEDEQSVEAYCRSSE